MAAFEMPIYPPVFMVLNAVIAVLPYLLDRLLSPRLAKNGKIPFSPSLIY